MNSVQRVFRLAAVAAFLIAGTAQAEFSSPMRNVENPDRFPYQETTYFTIDTPYVNNFGYFPTPAGKRYIIEYVSVSCVTPSASDTFPQVFINVSKNVPSGSVGYAIPAVNMARTGTSPFGGYVFSGTANVKVYADPSPYDASGGSAIYLNVFHADTGVKPSCSAAVSGHTISNP